MSKAVLLSGDKDFRPLVESLVRLGLFVEVVGDSKHFSVDLIHSADSHKILTIDEYFELTSNQTQTRKPCKFGTVGFFKDRNSAEKEGFHLHTKGVCENFDVYVFRHNDHSGYWLTTFSDLPYPETAFWTNHSLDNLTLYFEIKIGQIIWE